MYQGFASQAGYLEGASISPDINSSNFSKLVRVKYQLPITAIGENHEWLKELQKPISITITEIKKDLRKFASGFPLDRIPHTSNQELNALQMKQARDAKDKQHKAVGKVSDQVLSY